VACGQAAGQLSARPPELPAYGLVLGADGGLSPLTSIIISFSIYTSYTPTPLRTPYTRGRKVAALRLRPLQAGCWLIP
jgi:hypothetical protein